MGAGVFYFFNDFSGLFKGLFNGITGYAVYNDGIEMNINKDVSNDSYLLLNLEGVDYKKSAAGFGRMNENGSYHIDALNFKISDFGVDESSLSKGEHDWIASLVDNGNIVSLKMGRFNAINEENRNETINEQNITQPVEGGNLSTNITAPPASPPAVQPPIVQPVLPPEPLPEEVKSCNISSDCGENYYIGAPYCLNDKVSIIDRIVHFCPENRTCSQSRAQTINANCDFNETCFSGLCGIWGNVSNIAVIIPENISNVTTGEINFTNITAIETGNESISGFGLGEGFKVLSEVVVGKNVNVMERVVANTSGDMIITLPAEADNISVYRVKDEGNKVDSTNETMVLDPKNDGEARLDEMQKNKKEENTGVTGGAVFDFKKEPLAIRIANDIFSFFKDIFSTGSAFTPTGRAVEDAGIGGANDENISLKVRNVSDGEAIELYYGLPGPEMNVKDVSGAVKNIKVDSEFHYENVTAFYSMADPREPNVQRELRLYKVINGTKTPVNYIGHDADFNDIVEEIEWVVPHLSEEEYELDIIILNVQSYPVVGGNWEVGFNTTGEADLKISAVGGTTYDEVLNGKNDTMNDLGMLKLKCGDNEIFNTETGIYGDNVYFVLDDNSTIKAQDAVGSSLNATSLLVKDYSCEGTGRWDVKVLTAGKHYQSFDFGGLSAFAQNDAGLWWNETFHKCANININNANDSALTNFPALINVTYDSDMSNDFKDIRFVSARCSAGGSLLSFELDNYTTGNGASAYYWVKIPTIAAAGANISVYYGNLSAVDRGDNTSGTWDQYYIAVYHLSEKFERNPVELAIVNDSKQGLNGSLWSTNITAGYRGMVGGSYNFTDSVFNMTRHASFAPNQTGTVEMFVQRSWPDNHTDNQYLLGIYLNTTARIEWLWEGSVYNQYWLLDAIGFGGDYIPIYNWTFAKNTWAQMAMAWQNDSYAWVYANGILRNTPTSYKTKSWAGTPTLWSVGQTSGVGAGSLYRGGMDEVRFSRIIRSNQWINQTWDMASSQSSYVFFEAEQASGGCLNDGDCGSGFECIGQHCFSKEGRFVIQNVTGDNLTIIDKYGTMAIRGEWVSNCKTPAPDGSFQIQNKTNNVIYWISPQNGSMCAYNSTSISQQVSLTGASGMDTGGDNVCGRGGGQGGTKHSFRVQNQTNNVTCITDENGIGWIYTAGHYISNAIDM